MSQIPKSKGPVVPWIPPRAGQSLQQQGRRGTSVPAGVLGRKAVVRWKGAWRAGLVFGILPWVGLGLLLFCYWWVTKYGAEEMDKLQGGLILGAMAAGGVILLCSLVFAGIALVCAVVAMCLGAVGRGMFLVLLAVPVFAIYFLGSLQAAAREAEERRRPQVLHMEGTLRVVE